MTKTPFILRAKHWQMFGLVCLPSALVGSLFFIDFVKTYLSHTKIDILLLVIGFIIANVLYIIPFSIWSVLLFRKITSILSTKSISIKFYISILVVLLGLITQLILEYNILDQYTILMYRPEASKTIIDIYAESLLCVTILSLFAYIYSCLIISRLCFKLINFRFSKFNKFIYELFIFLFLPLGIWFLQPILNNLILKQGLDKIELSNEDF